MGSLKKIASIILIFFLGGCWTKCGLHYDYRCQCEEYYDASGKYIKNCPYDNLKIKSSPAQSAQNQAQQMQSITGK